MLEARGEGSVTLRNSRGRLPGVGHSAVSTCSRVRSWPWRLLTIRSVGLPVDVRHHCAHNDRDQQACNNYEGSKLLEIRCHSVCEQAHKGEHPTQNAIPKHIGHRSQRGSQTAGLYLCCAYATKTIQRCEASSGCSTAYMATRMLAQICKTEAVATSHPNMLSQPAKKPHTLP